MSSAQNRRASHFFFATFSRRVAVWLSLFFLLCVANSRSYALQGNIYSHDPSGLVKEGDRYYQFTTGPGIYSAYSTDLIFWTPAPNTVFPIGTWPSWINDAVPGFSGQFWAPDVIRLNDRWYCYYSSSTFGSSRSAIGVATSDSLEGPWEDQGADVAFCNPDNGSLIRLWEGLNNNCQKYKIERAADGSYVFTSLAGPRVVAPPAASTDPGLQFGLCDYVGQAWQKWGIDAAP